jgi:undecaprenyl-diphosphatase
MSFLEAVLLGILEGATEFLPISSTGHLILASNLLAIPETPFLTSFLIAVQLGAIAAVLLAYWRSFLDFEVLKRLTAAFLPTAIIGFILYKVIKGYLLNNELVVIISLLVGGIVIIAFEHFHKEKSAGEGTAVITDTGTEGASTSSPDSLASIRYRDAVAIGLFQSIAVIPGVSRSAATIIGGMLLGIRRAAIVEFSFLLAVPTMLAATGYDLLKTYDTFEAGNITLLLTGAATAFAVAFIAIRFLIAFVKRYSFTPFGVYRIVLALVFLAFVL